jgi:hypothetical protein
MPLGLLWQPKEFAFVLMLYVNLQAKAVFITVLPGNLHFFPVL